ncbi:MULTISPECIES: alpha/beta fold hydrolase [unclassified Gordonia (in: high G+C Gram-positive bacteria)]|uniref:alpha/beta fold hydrolase n=1 Tax=unclassified Gordonia (in: high G+C Gram-positive bacteria) TaxID=2657482 RepID=UPI0019666C9C|nr:MULTISPECIES: alpha/beta fold hydrolase [unclassified Gordonia (in: high G+C Gram-positive bacteria)]MBN0971175.1 alpha/beta fold hydrolase [Gordonia sp. BP-119]MBN0981795.1 alpha/beta fold hydrolase [Gordonia sp. BP-94]
MLTTLLDGELLAERHGGPSFSVVALHGWGRTRADWNPVLNGLDAIAIDLPGHGATPAPATAWGSPEYAEHILAALARELGDEDRKIVLLAHSFGGRVGIHMAALRPDLFSRLIFTGVPFIRPTGAGKSPVLFRIAKRLHRLELLPDSVMNQYRERYGSADYRDAHGIMREIFVKVVNENYDAAIATVADARIPMDLVWGSEDTAAPLSANAVIADQVPSAQLDVINGSGHMLDTPMRGALITAVKKAVADT